MYPSYFHDYHGNCLRLLDSNTLSAIETYFLGSHVVLVANFCLYFLSKQILILVTDISFVCAKYSNIIAEFMQKY